MKNINDGFPPDSLPYTDSYDYLSDSDLEDDELEEPRSDQNPGSGTTANEVPENPSRASQDPSGVENLNMSALNPIQLHDIRTNLQHRPSNGSIRMGKIAIVRDMAAVTYVDPVADQPSHPIDPLQLRGYGLFPTHWRGNLRPVEFGSMQWIDSRSEDRRLERSKSTISFGQINVPTCGQGERSFFVHAHWLIYVSTTYPRSKSGLTRTYTQTWNTAIL